jgi:hypothetical protein
MRAIKLIKGFKDKEYSDRLKILKLPTLKFRRTRGDMIEVYKIVTGLYDIEAAAQLPKNNYTNTRGNSFKLSKHHAHYDLRKYSFTHRVVDIWNSLSEHVLSAPSLNIFKNRLDTSWVNQELFYDFNADIAGIGNRSI